MCRSWQPIHDRNEGCYKERFNFWYIPSDITKILSPSHGEYVYLDIAVITRRPHPNPRVVNVIMILVLKHLREGTYTPPFNHSSRKTKLLSIGWRPTCKRLAAKRIVWVSCDRDHYTCAKTAFLMLVGRPEAINEHGGHRVAQGLEAWI